MSENVSNISFKSDNESFVVSMCRGKLTDNGATPWYAEMEIGDQSGFKFMIDTGTTHTWITSTECKTNACNCHRKYYPCNPLDPNNPVGIDFGPWGQMLACLCKDRFTLQDKYKVVIDETFYCSTYYTGDQFKELVCDGAIAIPSFKHTDHDLIKSNGSNIKLSKASYTDSGLILEKLKENDFINQCIVTFDFYPESKKGTCRFGDYTNNSTPNIIPIIKSGPYYKLWTICLDSLNYNGENILNNLNFILDTGSSRFKGDPEYINQIIDKITDGGRFPKVVDNENDLKNYNDITLEINTQSYTLKPDEYFLKIENENESVWKLAFHPMVGLENYLLVGSAFLDTVISSFNYDDSTITLYKKENNILNLQGKWFNEFGSEMILKIKDNKYVEGIYKSDTGATGTYTVVGIADEKPEGNSQTVAFAVSWRPIEKEKADPTFNWVSGFAGQLQMIDEEEVLTTTYLLSKNTNPEDNWGSTIVDKATFKRKPY